MRAWLACLWLVLAGCSGWSTAPSPVIIYSGRGEALVGELLARASAQTDVPIQIQYGSTPDLITRVLVEGDQGQADLIFAQEAGHFRALADKGRLATLPDALLSQVDPRFRDEDGQWIGTSGRLRVLTVHAPSVPDEERPTRLEQLAEPRFAGKLAWAPSNGSFQAHVAALLATWGPARTRAWLEGVKGNEPRVFPKNSPIVRAVAEGEVEVGWVNHYYLHQAKRPDSVAVNHSFESGDPGNLLMVAGVAVRSGSPQAEQAHKLIEWLISDQAQSNVAQRAWEYPTRPGVAPHPDVADLDKVGLADIAQHDLVELEPAREMLRELGLQ